MIGGIIVAFIFALIVGIVAVRKILADPNTVMLFSEQGAEWIRVREPIDLTARITQYPETFVSTFRLNLVVDKVPDEAVLKLRALKWASVFWDQQLIYVSDTRSKNWKKVYHVDLKPRISPGVHELYIKVMNVMGHPALLAYCESLKIYTNETWEGSKDEKTWSIAMPVNNIELPTITRKFKRTDRALISKLHIFLPIFLIVFFLTFYLKKPKRSPWQKHFTIDASMVRWILLALWVILAANNIRKIPLDVGMDFGGHLEYIRYVAENLRIPLAYEGWQMSETPLFYIISAIIYRLSLNIWPVETAVRLLHIIPALCGAAQVELCYRALRYAFPQRKDLQILGIVVGGLLPMNLYMSQAIGTESMAGFLTGMVIVLIFHLCNNPSGQPRDIYLLMGFWLGLSILTKITAILLIPLLLFFVAYSVSAGCGLPDRSKILGIQRIGLVLGVAFLVAGWYYINNWIEMGKFFDIGWDISRGIVWWQDPGHRTIRQFFTFGGSLFYPIYAGIMGLWDSLYSTMWLDGSLSGIIDYSIRPPWNYGLLLSSTWLSLLPSAAIFIGVLKTLKRPLPAIQQGTLFAAGCLIIYFTTILYFFLIIPFYSVGKATFTLGLIPCYAVLGAGGFDILTRKPFIRSTVYGIMACWAFGAYGAYFIR
ncbi:hypothetical protein ACFL0M_03465 [Thermodesulfobacteriota bacterium]